MYIYKKESCFYLVSYENLILKKNKMIDHLKNVLSQITGISFPRKNQWKILKIKSLTTKYINLDDKQLNSLMKTYTRWYEFKIYIVTFISSFLKHVYRFCRHRLFKCFLIQRWFETKMRVDVNETNNSLYPVS